MMNWQPIETCPADKSVLLFFDNFGISEGVKDPEGWYCFHGGNLFSDLNSHDPTHWQPLPEPPKALGGG